MLLLEDGLAKKVKRKRTKQELQRENVKKILAAAARGQVELPPDESFIVDSRTKASEAELDDRLAEQGFSLIEQVRADKPADLMKRNLKYMKYTDKKRKLDTEKAKSIVLEHLRKKSSKELVRNERSKITCLREPDPKKQKKDESVFTDEDFAVVAKKRKKLKKTEIEYL
ncbi:hypothetical protein OESDEN_18980 [Oesophagostomum dentatum]|uniref:Uncharacterized protein n=1 Tax=Oesophagostomum dentatum TaxID=61180 RepID=A0A0B1S8R2_OESDE|nr:hypothetical protein OESDEN_18980 [Oesophagostomum dentatum]